MATNYSDIVLEMARQRPILTSQEVSAQNIPRMVLKRLTASGRLLRVARGVYMHPDAEFGEHHSLVEAAARMPSGVVCLLSALVFHGLSDEVPFEVWMAYERGHTRPQVSELPVRLVAFSSAHFHYGVQRYSIEGIDVPITTPAKTIADCFKFRSQIGLEPCLSALKDYRRERVGTLDALQEAARVCRVVSVMRPYLEVIW